MEHGAPGTALVLVLYQRIVRGVTILSEFDDDFDLSLVAFASPVGNDDWESSMVISEKGSTTSTSSLSSFLVSREAMAPYSVAFCRLECSGMIL